MKKINLDFIHIVGQLDMCNNWWESDSKGLGVMKTRTSLVTPTVSPVSLVSSVLSGSVVSIPNELSGCGSASEVHGLIISTFLASAMILKMSQCFPE